MAEIYGFVIIKSAISNSSHLLGFGSISLTKSLFRINKLIIPIILRMVMTVAVDKKALEPNLIFSKEIQYNEWKSPVLRDCMINLYFLHRLDRTG